MSGSVISWAICKSAPRSRQITMPAPHLSVLLQAGCPSCRPTNSVKALKAFHRKGRKENTIRQSRRLQTCRPVLEEALCLVRPDTDKSFNRQRFKRTQRLTNASHPARHFTRTVDVMRLHVLCELVLQTGTRPDVHNYVSVVQNPLYRSSSCCNQKHSALTHLRG